MSLRDIPPLRRIFTAVAVARQLLPEIQALRHEVAVLEVRFGDQMRARFDASDARLDELERRVDGGLAGLEQSLAGMGHDAAARGLVLDALRQRLDIAAAEAADPNLAYLAALRRIGVLNYENSVVSGEQRFLERFLARTPGAVVLDVGANAGQFAELARELGPHAVIHCFEPHPVAFAALAAQAESLGITAHPLALSDAGGEIEFFDYADEPGSQHASVYREVIEGVHQRPAASLRVPCTTLDEVAATLGLARLDLLKIDTEGHELAVLQGAQGLLRRGAIDVIQFEFNEMNAVAGVFMRQFFEILADYRLFRLLPEGAIALERYDPRSMEIFAYQNIAGIRRDLDHHWIMAG